MPTVRPRSPRCRRIQTSTGSRAVGSISPAHTPERIGPRSGLGLSVLCVHGLFFARTPMANQGNP